MWREKKKKKASSHPACLHMFASLILPPVFICTHELYKTTICRTVKALNVWGRQMNNKMPCGTLNNGTFQFRLITKPAGRFIAPLGEIQRLYKETLMSPLELVKLQRWLSEKHVLPLQSRRRALTQIVPVAWWDNNNGMTTAIRLDPCSSINARLGNVRETYNTALILRSKAQLKNPLVKFNNDSVCVYERPRGLLYITVFPKQQGLL